MKKLALAAAVAALLVGGAASTALAAEGGSGDANCQNGGVTSATPPGYVKHGFPPGTPHFAGSVGGQKSNGTDAPQGAFFRCVAP